MKKTIFASILLVAGMLNQTWAQCDAPSNLTANYNNNVSAFMWGAVIGSDYYVVEFKQSYVNSWDFVEYADSSTTNSLSLTGIMHSVSVDWRVRTVCANGTSTYSEASYTAPCPEPTALMASNITPTGATISWVPAVGYDTQVSDFVAGYRILGTTGAWTSLGHTSVSSLTINGLVPSTTYEYYVRQSCVYANSNSVVGQFTTLASACPAPVDIAVNNITSTSATISWLAANGGLSYSVQYKSANTSIWSTPVIVTSTSANITGLVAATTYDVRVKTNCTSYPSDYSTSQFVTYPLTCSSNGNNASEFIDYFKLGSISRTSGKENGGYTNTGLTTSLEIGSVNNVGQISAGFSRGGLKENYAIYIDFNRNGSYSDPNELVVASTLIKNASVYNFRVSIPSTVTPGLCKMRVVMRRTGSSISPCATGFNGEVEDYYVTLVDGNNLRSADNTEELVVENLSTNVISNKVYPNPSNGEFTFEANSKTSIAAYSIVNIYGQTQMYDVVDGGNSFNIDIRHLPSGIYIVIVTDTEGASFTQRLQKQ